MKDMTYTVRLDFKGSYYCTVRADNKDDAIEKAYELYNAWDVYKWDIDSEIVEVEEDD